MKCCLWPNEYMFSDYKQCRNEIYFCVAVAHWLNSSQSSHVVKIDRSATDMPSYYYSCH